MSFFYLHAHNWDISESKTCDTHRVIAKCIICAKTKITTVRDTIEHDWTPWRYSQGTTTLVIMGHTYGPPMPAIIAERVCNRCGLYQKCLQGKEHLQR